MQNPIEQFRVRVERLVERFEKELAEGEWATRRYPKRFVDATGRRYEIPALYLQKGPVKLLLDPIGYDVPGAEGLCDIYHMPAYDPAASLYFEGGDWRIHYAFPPDPLEANSVVETKDLPVTRDSILNVLDSVVDHASEPI